MLTLLVFLQGNVKKLMKLLNIDKEYLHIFRMTRGILMKFLREIRLMIIQF